MTDKAGALGSLVSAASCPACFPALASLGTAAGLGFLGDWVSACTPPCAAAPITARRWKQLCRYITRPALANERVQCNAAGQVVLKLKTAWHDGTTHIVMSPLEFMQRLAALVPRPRLHLIRLVSA